MKIIFSELTDTPSHKYQPGIEYDMDDARAQAFIDAGAAKLAEAKETRPRKPPRRKAIKPDIEWRKVDD